jgi:chromate transporter
MGLSGFGGVLPFVRRSVVERNRWLNDRDFVEILSWAGAAGAQRHQPGADAGPALRRVARCVAAFSGLVFVPMVVVLCAMGVYLRFQDVPQVRQMLAGMTAVAAGLVLSTGVKLAQSQPRTVRAVMVGVAAFVAIGCCAGRCCR